MDWYDREVEALERELEDGTISNKEFNRAMAELNRDLRAEAEEAALDAYNDRMGYW